MPEVAASILARLGLDKRGFSDDLRSAASEAEAGGGRIGRGLDVATAGHEKLLTSSHRAARQIGNFARELTSGASSADIFAAAIEGVERVLRLPLGALAGLVGAGFVIKEIAEVRTEYQKLKDALEVALHPGLASENAALETLADRIKALQELENQLKQKDEKGIGSTFRDAITGFGNTKFKFSDFIKDTNAIGLFPTFFKTFLGGTLGDINSARTERAQQLRAADTEKVKDIEIEIKKIRESGVDVESRIAKVKLDAARGELAAAKTVEDKKARQLAVDQAQLAAEKADADQKAAKSVAGAKSDEVAKSLREASQVSLAELAKEGDQTRSNSGYALGVGAKARDAVREQELSRQAAFAGNEEEALKHTTRAEEIKSGIGSLRDNEKQLGSAFRNALEAASYSRIVDAINKINFANR